MTLESAGLLCSALGSLALGKGLFITKKRAIELSKSRWVGETDEENEKLITVQDRLNQRTWGLIGATLLVIGFFLQYLG